MIYFDNAATTYPKPEEVYQSIDYAQRNLAFNADRGFYKESNRAHEIIEKTRNKLCKMTNAEGLIFTSSATYALNQVIAGIDFNRGDIVYCSPYDHNAIVRTLHAYTISKKIVLKIMPLRDDLSIDMEKFEFECIRDNPKAIFCSHVSNVTGYILPIESISKIAQRIKSIFVVDGAQALGVLNIDLKKTPINYYIFAGHKTLYGPFGVAGYLYNVIDLKVSFYGGTGTDSLNLDMPLLAPSRYEPSSMNIVAIVGLLTSLEWLVNINVLDQEMILKNYLLDKLTKLDDVIIYSNLESLGIISFNIKGYTSEDVSKILAQDFDIAVRSGYHCCPLIHDYLDDKKFLGTVRVSIGYFNTKKEIDVLIRALEELIMEV